MFKKIINIFRGKKFRLENTSLSPEIIQLIRNIRDRNLTYLSEKKLFLLADTCDQIEKNHVPGRFIEAGCALGGSSILLAKIKNKARQFCIHDVFGTIPPPTEKDPKESHERYRVISSRKSTGIGGDVYYGYIENLLDVVIQNLLSFGITPEADSVSLIQGFVQDTLQVQTPVALAHIDVDWYEPVAVCLQRIYPQLTVGGSIILDDYKSWGGCKQATDEFLANLPGGFSTNNDFGSMKITKTAP